MRASVLKILLVNILILNAFSCKEVKNEPLTNKQVEAYLNTYKELRNTAPDMLEKANSGSLDAQKEGLTQFTTILEKNGLNYTGFIRLNAKIGAIYSVVNAEHFMENIQKQVDDSKKHIEEGIKLMQEQIDDPEVPEETKEELRKSIEDLKATEKGMKLQHGKNKLQAEAVLKKVKVMTNQYIAKEDVELVNNYYDEITQAYTGGIVPVNFNIRED